jgi:membrane protein
MKKNLLSPKQFWQLLKQAGQSWVDNKSARLGAALAFYSVLSLAPLLLLVLTAAAAIWGQKAAQGNIMGQMTSIIGREGAEAIQSILAASEQNKSGGLIATLTGIVTLLFSASGVFGELQDSMNLIWKAKPRQGQAILVMLRERFTSFTMVVGSGFLMLISLLVSAALSVASQYVNGLLPDFVLLMQAINFLISFGVIALLFAMTFKVVPDVSVPWRDVWPGGILTAALFIIGKMVIGFYLGHAGMASTYGAAGSFVALLLWVYYSAQILFFGAEFTYAYSCYAHPRPANPPIG